jgi:hypothetical protein
MKWLWIGFALIWALSVVLDGRRRARSASIKRAETPAKPPADNEAPPVAALLTARITP